MNAKVEQFIVDHLDIIDQDDWMQIFLRAYNDFDNSMDIKVLLMVLKDAGLDYDKIIQYRDAALRFIITQEMEDLPENSRWSVSRFTELLNNYLGLKYDELMFFIYNEQNEWPDNIHINGDSADYYIIEVF